MSSPSEYFECRWQGSRLLLTAYLACQALAGIALWLSATPWWLALALFMMCLAHACWVIPRRILLSHPNAITGLRRDPLGWRVFSRAQGWQSVRLLRDSLALPHMVVLRFVREGRWLGQSQCIPSDALTADQHRRLRVRLKFSRRRWAPIDTE
ncbi:toxin CptA [Pseudomonas hunanensis]|uniref:Toxin CptA n=1 Tax=Pseudomonas hunanensis TaxID=1247546 RepID=A0ACC6K3H6_9PSED|nr:protein YgfX [Pseudomonas hunanensis]MDR6713001.1 toxin CptA [Pseudomonas hunanensis]